MTPPADLRREQRGVGRRMAGAICVTIAAFAAALAWGPVASPADRMALALAVATLPLLWLAGGIGNVARLRFFSPDDIAGGAAQGSAAVRTASAILQNTLEQTVLALPTYAIAAMTLDRATGLLIVAGTLFTIGRLLFWRGYANGATRRALGFALTFYPTATLLLVAIAGGLRSLSA